MKALSIKEIYNVMINEFRGNVCSSTKVSACDVIDKVQDILIYKNHKALRSKGHVIVMSTIMENELVSTPLIIFDNTYDKMSKNLRNFLILHEIGHILHGDLQTKEKETCFLCTTMGELSEREHQADLYASKEIGLKNTRAALKELLKLVEEINLPNKKIINEIKKRLAYYEWVIAMDLLAESDYKERKEKEELEKVEKKSTTKRTTKTSSKGKSTTKKKVTEKKEEEKKEIKQEQ